MWKIAFKTLLHNRGRSLSTVTGVAVSFFLSLAQLGLLVGWCNTTSAIVRHADVDIWVMAAQTPAFDYGTGIPKVRISQTQTVPGVDWAQGMFMGWNYWQRPDGRRVNIELVGLDDDCIGGPWQMQSGSADCFQIPNHVIVDGLYLDALGVKRIGDEAEILGRRAVVGAISSNVRTFTAAPYVFTSLSSAIKYDRRSNGDQVTYVLVRCEEGYSPEVVCKDIEAHVPGIEALTTSDFAVRTVKYWMLETGIGITVVLTALLGLVVGAVIVSQTIAAITHEHRSDYATLLAIGFRQSQLTAVVAIQSLLLGILGIVIGSVMFMYASRLSERSPIPLDMIPGVFVGAVVAVMSSCVAASAMSVKSICHIDPVTVLRA